MSPEPRAGSVTLIGAGPGDPDLLTVKAILAINAADVILHDALVSDEILDLVPSETALISVGKRGHRPSCAQKDIDALLVRLARDGYRVARLKVGDPSVFGRSGEEIGACEAAGIPVSVVPGVTAASAAAADLQISLTHRDHACRLEIVTGHARDGELPGDLDFRALADPAATVVVYMGKARLGAYARRVLDAGADPDLPVIAVENAGRAGTTTLSGTLGSPPDLASLGDGPVLILTGAVLGARARSARAEASPSASRHR
jgi:uroporphyrin-III C-methyltransferase / precorrin-2 dehydrogenase / sirohydrochlorin ferrochelatase